MTRRSLSLPWRQSGFTIGLAPVRWKVDVERTPSMGWAADETVHLAAKTSVQRRLEKKRRPTDWSGKAGRKGANFQLSSPGINVRESEL